MGKSVRTGWRVGVLFGRDAASSPEMANAAARTKFRALARSVHGVMYVVPWTDPWYTATLGIPGPGTETRPWASVGRIERSPRKREKHSKREGQAPVSSVWLSGSPDTAWTSVMPLPLRAQATMCGSSKGELAGLRVLRCH